jgi:hypothetical protein
VSGGRMTRKFAGLKDSGNFSGVKIVNARSYKREKREFEWNQRLREEMIPQCTNRGPEMVRVGYCKYL